MLAHGSAEADHPPLPAPPAGASFRKVSYLEPSRHEKTSAYRKRSPWSPAQLLPASAAVQDSDSSLPAFAQHGAVAAAARNNDICYIRGAPGCGKSTQIPQIIAEANRCSNQWSSAYIWHTVPFVEASRGLFQRLLHVSQDVAHHSCVSWYNGRYNNEYAGSREIIAVLTARTALLRMNRLIENAQK